VPSGKLQAGCPVPFIQKWLLSGHSTIKAWLVECCRDSCPSGRFSHLHRGTLALCQSDHWVLGHVPDQGPSPPMVQFARWPALGRVLVVPNFFHLRMMATVFWGTFDAAEIFWYLSPDLCLDTILSQGFTNNSFNLMAWFSHALSTVGPYIDRCAFQNHVHGIWILSECTVVNYPGYKMCWIGCLVFILQARPTCCNVSLSRPTRIHAADAPTMTFTWFSLPYEACLL
jgi:hypothetical protein